MSKSLVVVKHNALITGRYSLGLVEQRLMLTIISKIDSMGEWDGKDGVYEIDFGEVLDLIDSKHESKRQQMMGVTDELLSKTVTIELKKLDDDLREKFKRIKLEDGEPPLDFNNETIQTKWLIPPLRYRMGDDTLKVKVDKFLMPFLIEIKRNFTRYFLEEIMVLRSKYSIRIYEYLRSFLREGVILADIDYQNFREIIGVEDGKYTRFTDFNRRVLFPSVQEINEKTSLDLEFNLKRRRTQVIRISFKVKEKKKTETTKTETKTETTKTTKTKTEIILERIGVENPSQYAIPDQIWMDAIKENQPNAPPSFVVTSAKILKKRVQAIKEEEEQKKKQDEISKKNKRFWSQNYQKYHKISGNSNGAYLQPEGRIPILFNDSNFIDLVKPYLIPEEEISKDQRNEIADRLGPREKE